jgi:D-cysteine desulfhydrase family pyridoxal phosphate-dependent enzyme
VTAPLLDPFPRIHLAHLPTPLEPMRRLGEELGCEIWVKRDDCTGLGLGGNKVRKLEFLLGAAREDGAELVITVGGVQSNHARQTAAAAAKLGMRCQLVLPRVVPRAGVEYEGGGNVLLDRLFGAEVFIVDDEVAAARTIQRLLAQAQAKGIRAVAHPPGGSTAEGSLGYVNAGLELAQQVAAGAPHFARIFVASGSGGTVAGLVCGLSAAALKIPVTAVCVAGSANEHRAQLDILASETCALLGISAPPSEALQLDDGFLGAGYGVPATSTHEALRLAASREGLLLDPVYTGKAMAALVAAARSRASGPLLFWHTGGMPGLFAYREELEAAACA